MYSGQCCTYKYKYDITLCAECRFNFHIWLLVHCSDVKWIFATELRFVISGLIKGGFTPSSALGALTPIESVTRAFYWMEWSPALILFWSERETGGTVIQVKESNSKINYSPRIPAIWKRSSSSHRIIRITASLSPSTTQCEAGGPKYLNEEIVKKFWLTMSPSLRPSSTTVGHKSNKWYLCKSSGMIVRYLRWYTPRMAEERRRSSSRIGGPKNCKIFTWFVYTVYGEYKLGCVIYMLLSM